MMNYKHKFFMYVMLMSFLECGIYSYIFIQSVALPVAISIAFILTVFRYIMAFIFESKSKFAEYILLSSDTFAITTMLTAVLFIPIYYVSIIAVIMCVLMMFGLRCKQERLKNRS